MRRVGKVLPAQFVLSYICKLYNFFHVRDKLSGISLCLSVDLRCFTIVFVFDCIDDDSAICMEFFMFVAKLLPDWKDTWNIGSYCVIKMSESALCGIQL